jgi:hypothetical protein
MKVLLAAVAAAFGVLAASAGALARRRSGALPRRRRMFHGVIVPRCLPLPSIARSTCANSDDPRDRDRNRRSSRKRAPRPSARKKGSEVAQVGLLEPDATVACERRANVVRTSERPRECPRVTAVCRRGTYNYLFTGIFSKPPDGLEPSTPSLPSWNQAGTRGHERVPAATKAPQVDGV